MIPILKKATPKISVIIPAYNCAKYISEALYSLQAQSISEWEAIVIDDGSTDNTADIVLKIATQDPRICLFRQQASGKPSLARNAGLKKATGDFICFLDADDYYAPNKFERCLSVITTHPETGLIFHDINYVNENREILPNSYLDRCNFRTNAEKILVFTKPNEYHCDSRLYFFISTSNASTILPSSVFMRRKNNIFFSDELLVGEDLDLWLRLLSENMLFIFVDEILAYYRQHNNNLTARKPSLERDRITLHKTNYSRSQMVFSLRQKLLYRNFIAQLYANGGFELDRIKNPQDGFKAFLNSFLWLPNWFALKGCTKTLVKILSSEMLKSLSK